MDEHEEQNLPTRPGERSFAELENLCGGFALSPATDEEAETVRRLLADPDSPVGHSSAMQVFVFFRRSNIYFADTSYIHASMRKGTA